jgi:hypothetical protein
VIDSTPNIVLDSREGLMYIADMEIVMKMIKGSELKAGMHLIQKHQGEMKELLIEKAHIRPDGILKLLVAHPSLSSVGQQGKQAIFIPADKINLEFPVKEEN